MFTSRAEYRLLLRQDNADIRLTKKGYDIGLATKDRVDKLNNKINESNKLLSFLEKQSVSPEEINSLLSEKGSASLKQKVKLKTILSRPHIWIEDLLVIDSLNNFIKESKISLEAMTQTEIQVKYSGYINKEKDTVLKITKLEKIIIPDKFDYSKLQSVSTEGREKLNEIRPKSIGQASRISGVSPSDINVLLIYIGR